jgi:predicted Fe-Mo cluster-binding NifX family protein
VIASGGGHDTAADHHPGLAAGRLVRLMTEAISRCQLDLAGHTVLTEAASGAYVVTPVLAALAGAQVYAVAATTSYATDRELRATTAELGRLAGVADRLHLVCEKSAQVIAAADIVTNSGQVRPIDAPMIALMKPSAVVTLMYESWEFRSTDVDLNACRARGIRIAGVNEDHPAVDFFAFLGPMAIKQLHDAGISVYRSRIVLLCDNSFGPFIAKSLQNCGAEVVAARRLTRAVLSPPCDAVLLALRPASGAVLTAEDAKILGERAPGTVLVQYWGDVDRASLAAEGVPVWPPEPPRAGHMAVLPSAIGPEPVVRLQSAGLKVGEILARGLDQATPQERMFVQPL